ISALYLSISKDQASSLPDRHSLTRRVSSQTVGAFFGALVVARLIEERSPEHFSNRAVPHSRVRKVREQPAENSQANSWRRQEYPGSPGKSSADSRRESPGLGHRALCAVRTCARSFVHRSGGRSLLPIRSRDAPAMDSKDASRRLRAKH